jgi:hypothetical protein
MPPRTSGKSLPWRRVGLFDRRLKNRAYSESQSRAPGSGADPPRIAFCKSDAANKKKAVQKHRQV